MRDNYYRDRYGSVPMGGYDMYGADTFREYEGEIYNPKDYKEVMKENYQIYKDQKSYAPKELSMQGLNDTLESVVNVMAMLKKEARSPQEMDLIKRYIITINNL